MPSRVKKRLAVLVLGATIGACATLWFGHFRYAGLEAVEEDRWAGITEPEAIARFGEPTMRYGTYQSIGLAENTRGATHSWRYATLVGTLYLYFKDAKCVESLYFSDNVKF